MENKFPQLNHNPTGGDYGSPVYLKGSVSGARVRREIYANPCPPTREEEEEEEEEEKNLGRIYSGPST